jgi:hypothetical protein
VDIQHPNAIAAEPRNRDDPTGAGLRSSTLGAKGEHLCCRLIVAWKTHIEPIQIDETGRAASGWTTRQCNAVAAFEQQRGTEIEHHLLLDGTVPNRAADRRTIDRNVNGVITFGKTLQPQRQTGIAGSRTVQLESEILAVAVGQPVPIPLVRRRLNQHCNLVLFDMLFVGKAACCRHRIR